MSSARCPLCQRGLVEGRCPFHGAPPTAPHAVGAFWEEPEPASPAAQTRELSGDSGDLRLSPGAVLGDYTVVDVLGAGGQGVVYAVVDAHKRPFALKLLTDPASKADLESEGRLLMKVQHPNVLRVERVVVVDTPGATFPALVMERVRGRSLAEVVSSARSLSWGQFRPWLVQALSALGAIHEVGVVHRDVKPENLLLADEGQLKLIDFGTARDASAGPVPPTRTSVVRGTLDYMSPEQLRGEALDPRTDLFSLGCVASLALSGRLPWPGTPVASARARIEREAEPLSAPLVPAGIAALLTSMVRRARAERPATARGALERIGRVS